MKTGNAVAHFTSVQFSSVFRRRRLRSEDCSLSPRWLGLSTTPLHHLPQTSTRTPMIKVSSAVAHEGDRRRMETEERSQKMGRMSRTSTLFVALLFLAGNVKSAKGKDELATVFSDTAESLTREPQATDTPTRAKRSTTGFAYHGLIGSFEHT